MQTPFGKRRISGGLAIAVGLAAFGGSLVSTEAAFAASPATGVNCAVDGKIDGRGSTYQTRAQADFWAAFQSDVCGVVASQGANDVTVTGNMGIYNDAADASGNFTGSGAGLKAVNCRTDAYAGTDLPYSEAQLAGMDGVPGNAVIGGCSSFPLNPFAPDAATNTTGTPPAVVFPSASDAAGNVMSFPIAGSSESIAINLQASDCGSGVKPSGITFTGTQMDLIWGGSVANWNDPRLEDVLTPTQNASLSTCNVPIVRVTRMDNSGTTAIFKNYLINVNDARTGATCDPGPTWTSFDPTATTNAVWPTGPIASCSNLIMPTGSGGPALINLLGATDGGIGYADLADELAGPVPAPPTPLIVASIENGAGTGPQTPAAGKAANCDFSVVSLPGGGPSGAVGLNSGDNWASDNSTVNSGSLNHINVTDQGIKYPICGLTFDLVFAGLSAPTGSPIAGLNADQRRTLYSYFTYVLSNTAQNKLPNDDYSALPPAWTPTLLSGFQTAF